MDTTASFRLGGQGALTAAAITRRLAVEPTRSFEVGDPVSTRSTRQREAALWLLSSSDEIEHGVELAVQLGRLLDKLECVTADLWELVEAGYEANWFCYVASNPTEHAVELDRSLLTRLLKLPGDLWLDVCGDDPAMPAGGG